MASPVGVDNIGVSRVRLRALIGDAPKPNQFRPDTVWSPWEEGFLRLKEAFSCISDEPSVSLKSRATHLLIGSVLLIPVINWLFFSTICKKLHQHWIEKSDLYGLAQDLDRLKHWLKEGKIYWNKPIPPCETNILFLLSKFHTDTPLPNLSLVIPWIAQSVNPSIQEKGGYGNTALLWAIASANNETALHLIHAMTPHGLDIKDTYRSYGNTALHVSISKGYQTGKPDGYGKKIIKLSNFELTKALIEKGADVNLKNANGNTPLHLACARRDVETIQLLLENGANATIQNNQGNTPQQLLNLGYIEVCLLLKKTVDFFRLEESAFNENFESAEKLFSSLAENSPPQSQ